MILLNDQYSLIKLRLVKNKNENEPVEIFAGTTWKAEMIKSLLKNAEIEAFLEDEIIGTIGPWWTAPGGAGSVRVFVSKKYYERAKLVADNYEKNEKESK